MFNARDERYKNPVGAVAEGTKIHYKLRVPRELQCSGARLLMHEDNTKEVSIHELYWCGMDGDLHEFWECDFTPEAFGLYFYSFELETDRGITQINRQKDGTGSINTTNSWWQQTVYQKDFTTPDWLAGGVMYQIFPDRFYSSGQPKEGVPEDRHFHENWLDQPEWRPNSKGEVTNSDYFGGDLQGILEKLPYLKQLGVTCLYLNPIFEAHSNHRYNTADYSKIDPILGTEETFRALCAKAKHMGIRVILDGVFSHTGSDSIYFNKEGRYDSEGAYQSQTSPYYPWYQFRQWPEDYECWWNFNTLPNVIETNPAYDRYINGEDGIVQKWLDCGASGWRLDVADELPDEFIDSLSRSAKAKKSDALVLGEVWEDASNKTAYGVRRRYLLGGQLDSVMNYPFRDAILSFLTGGSAEDAMEQILSIVENYPPQVVRLLMNHIGTHDTERAITALAGEPMNNRGREWQWNACMDPAQWEIGFQKMRLASLLQFTLPGVPCVYYGDEAGVEGYKDPFNRTSYPWGNENQELIHWYQRLGALRAGHVVFREGTMQPVCAKKGVLAFRRVCAEEELLIAVNRDPEYTSLALPEGWENCRVLMGTVRRGIIHLERYGLAVVQLQKQPSAPRKAQVRKHIEKN